MSPKKKILILIDWFAPGYKAGGPIQSCVNLCNALKDQCDIYVLTTDTDHGETAPYSAIESNKWVTNTHLGIQIFYAKKKGLGSKQLANEIKAVDADFVYLNHLFSPMFVVYPLWLKWSGKINGKMIVCPRGALFDSALNLKRYKKGPLLLLYKWMGIHKKICFHATNEREQIAIEKYFPGSKIKIADNLPSVIQDPFTTIEKQTGSINCVYIARIVPIKNLLFLLLVLQQIKAIVQLTIIGPIEDAAYWALCENAIKLLPENIRVNYKGAVNNSLLPAIVQQHHLYILPTTGENFGHSIFEALLAGRPVLISDQTPWINLPDSNAGWDLPLNNPEQFITVIEEMALYNQQEFNTIAKAAWQYSNNFISNPQLTLPYHKLFA